MSQAVFPRPARRLSSQNRLLANRRIWKSTIYSLALLTYLCSFLFFGMAVAEVRQVGADALAVFDLLVAMYFLIQVIFLFILSWIVERRRQSLPIVFADRRAQR